MKARFFNNIVRNGNVVIKSSTDIYKIKSEFNYYYLLPKELRKFYVKPYNYRETQNEAMYDMEYSGITLYDFISSLYRYEGEDFDKAIKKVIKQLKEYFKLKNKYSIQCENDHFVKTKVINRIEKLKKLPEYKTLNNFLEMTNINIDNLVDNFIDDYSYLDNCETIKKVISHGDLHFSNILINEKTYNIKFIDVRGAMKEEELYMDVYYDYAKLYHSIQGLYDFIVNDRYELNLSEDLKSYSLRFNVNTSLITDVYLKIYKEIFLKKLSTEDLEIIRIYTQSLFLSMLPLHKENLLHVISFIRISQKLPILKIGG